VPESRREKETDSLFRNMSAKALLYSAAPLSLWKICNVLIQMKIITTKNGKTEIKLNRNKI